MVRPSWPGSVPPRQAQTNNLATQQTASKQTFTIRHNIVNTNNFSKSVVVAAMLALLGGCDNRSASTTASAPAETGASAPPAQAQQVCYR